MNIDEIIDKMWDYIDSETETVFTYSFYKNEEYNKIVSSVSYLDLTKALLTSFSCSHFELLMICTPSIWKQFNLEDIQDIMDFCLEINNYEAFNSIVSFCYQYLGLDLISLIYNSPDSGLKFRILANIEGYHTYLKTLFNNSYTKKMIEFNDISHEDINATRAKFMNQGCIVLSYPSITPPHTKSTKKWYDFLWGR